MDTELLRLRERVLVARENRVPLQLHGARTKDFYGETVSGEPLDLSRYRGIIDYEPSELVITARCGTRLSEIETALAERDQFLGFEPPRPVGDPTIGGVIATGLSGPRRMQAGAARDFVLGAALMAGDGEVLRFGDMTLDPIAHEVHRGDRLVELSKTEFMLLELFMKHPRQVLTRSTIFENVWGYDFGPTSNALGVYIGYLRRKTEEGGESRVLHTVRGIGYVLRD